MARLRFSTAQQVIDAYPSLAVDLSLPTNSDDPFIYIDRLLKSPKPEEAFAFCAFLLPRLEAVAWLCKTIRSSSPSLSQKEEQPLALAESWIKTPTEAMRQNALQTGMNATRDAPSTWAALAAGWSGGSITSNVEHPVPPPVHLTGLAVKLGLQVLLAHLPPALKAESIAQFSRSAILILKEDKT